MILHLLHFLLVIITGFLIIRWYAQTLRQYVYTICGGIILLASLLSYQDTDNVVAVLLWLLAVPTTLYTIYRLIYDFEQWAFQTPLPEGEFTIKSVWGETKVCRTREEAQAFMRETLKAHGH